MNRRKGISIFVVIAVILLQLLSNRKLEYSLSIHLNNQLLRKNSMADSRIKLLTDKINLIVLIRENQQNNIFLQEIPELRYHTPYINSDSGYTNSEYAYFGEALVVCNNIYKKQNGKYLLTGTLNELIGIQENLYIQYAQYGAYLILRYNDTFYFYHMDTWLCMETREIPVFSWCIFQENIIYLDKETRALRQFSLSNENWGNDSSLYKHKGEQTILSDFRIRKDGTVVIRLYDKKNHIYAFWTFQTENNSILNMKKIGEFSEWDIQCILDFNSYGLVLQGKETPFIIIKDNNEIEYFHNKLLWNYLFLDEGFIVGEYDSVKGTTFEELWEAGHKVNTVQFYNYEDCLLNTYQLMDRELLEEGFYLTNFVYDHKENLLTGFYMQENTNKLVISQVQLNDTR